MTDSSMAFGSWKTLSWFVFGFCNLSVRQMGEKEIILCLCVQTRIRESVPELASGGNQDLPTGLLDLRSLTLARASPWGTTQVLTVPGSHALLLRLSASHSHRAWWQRFWVWRFIAYYLISIGKGNSGEEFPCHRAPGFPLFSFLSPGSSPGSDNYSYPWRCLIRAV